MKIIFPHEVPVPAGCAPDSCYYISYQKPLVYNGQWVTGMTSAARAQDRSTIVADLRAFSPMENGEETLTPVPRLHQLRDQCN